jgi:hypothetical protein
MDKLFYDSIYHSTRYSKSFELTVRKINFSHVSGLIDLRCTLLTISQQPRNNALPL